MIIEISVKSPPFSINNAYYRNRQRTQECRLWGDRILLQLQSEDIQHKFNRLREEFNPLEHHLKVAITHIMPTRKLRTKDGSISKLSNDLTNIEKLPIDLIFDHRYNGRIIKNNMINNLDIDDKYITELISKKVPGPHYEIRVEISLLNLNNL